MCGTHARGFCFSDDLCCIAFNHSYTYDALGNLIYRQLPNVETSTTNTISKTNSSAPKSKSRQQTYYFHCYQIGILREITDIHGNLLFYGEYTTWGRLKEETRVTDNAYQSFRLQNQYADRETEHHYNFFRYYELDYGRFTNQDPIGL